MKLHVEGPKFTCFQPLRSSLEVVCGAPAAQYLMMWEMEERAGHEDVANKPCENHRQKHCLFVRHEDWGRAC